MKNINYILFALVIFFLGFSPYAFSNNGKVEIEITGLKNNNGQVVIKIFNDSDGFPRKDEKAFKIYKAQIQNLKCHSTLELPTGEYAIAVNHDENQNGKVDTNFIGIPKEPLGMSNYPEVGKPDYEKAKFTVTDNQTIKLIIPVNMIF